MEMTGSPEMPRTTHKTEWCHNPDDYNSDFQHCKNVTFHTISIYPVLFTNANNARQIQMFFLFMGDSRLFLLTVIQRSLHTVRKIKMLWQINGIKEGTYKITYSKNVILSI
jgi:hypothetical protein